jgi:hypothetical protein
MILPSKIVRMSDEDVKEGDLVIPPKDFGMPVEKNLRHNMLPKTVYRLHGCNSCEWRGTELCGLKKKKEGKPWETMVPSGICQDRMNYLLNFVPEDENQIGRMTYEQWRYFYNQAIAQTQLMDDWQKLQDSLNDASSTERQKSLLRRNWIELHKLLSDNDNKAIDRQTPKKLEIEDRRLSANDVIKLMRDAEFETEKKNAIDAELKEA